MRVRQPTRAAGQSLKSQKERPQGVKHDEIARFKPSLGAIMSVSERKRKQDGMKIEQWTAIEFANLRGRYSRNKETLKKKSFRSSDLKRQGSEFPNRASLSLLV